MNNKLIVTSQKTPIEVLLQIDEDGRTTSKALYDFLEFHPANYNRWCKDNIEKNKFATKNVDFTPFILNDERQMNPNPTKNYKLTASFAKKLAMASKSPKGEQAREYFILIEEKLKGQAVAVQQTLSPELQMIKGLFENAVKQEHAIRDLREDVDYIKTNINHNIIDIVEAEPDIIRDNHQIMLAELKNDVTYIRYSTTDIARAFGLRSAKLLNQYLAIHGIIEQIDGVWEMTERYAGQSYCVHKEKSFWWTEKGAEFILEFMKTKGYRQKQPLIREKSRNKASN